MKCSRRQFFALAGGSVLTSSVLALGDEEVGTCKARLRLLNDAINAWRRKYGDFPMKLGDLLRRGIIADAHVLICPGAEREVSFKAVEKGILTSTESDPAATYEYELSNDAKMNPLLVEGLDDKSRRAWKKALLTTAIKQSVPIVRCERHARTLNLTAEGTIYESGGIWEYDFVELLPEIYAMPFLAQTRAPSIHNYVAARPTGLDASCLDLKDAANALPGDPWLDGFDIGDSLKDFPPSTGAPFKTADGILYDCRYLVQVCGKTGSERSWRYRETFGGPSYPQKARPITFKAGRGDRAHVLQACAYPTQVGSNVGEIVISTADGAESQRTPLVYGENTLVWRAGSFAEGSQPKAVWKGVTGSSGWNVQLYEITVPLKSAASDRESYFLRLQANVDDLAGPFILGVTISHS